MDLFEKPVFKDAIERRTKAPNMILFVVHFGQALVLLRSVDEDVENYLNDGGVSFSQETWELDGAGVGYTDFGSEAVGVFIGRLKWENEGPSDWDDRKDEYGLMLADVRPATEAEWNEHVSGNWPWDYETEERTKDNGGKEKE